MGFPIVLRKLKPIQNNSRHLKKNNYLVFSKLEFKNCVFEREIKLMFQKKV